MSGDTDTGLFQASGTPNTLSIAARGTEVARFEEPGNATAVNYLRFIGTGTGVPAKIAADGSDTDIGIQLSPTNPWPFAPR